MIRTTFSNPIIFQNDNSYSLPTHTGAVQWNGAAKKFQVSTGSSWVNIDNDVSYNVSYELLKVITWVENKMKEDQEVIELAKHNPTVKDLLDQIKEKQDQIEVIKTILKSES